MRPILLPLAMTDRAAATAGLACRGPGSRPGAVRAQEVLGVEREELPRLLAAGRLGERIVAAARMAAAVHQTMRIAAGGGWMS